MGVTPSPDLSAIYPIPFRQNLKRILSQTTPFLTLLRWFLTESIPSLKICVSVSRFHVYCEFNGARINMKRNAEVSSIYLPHFILLRHLSNWNLLQFTGMWYIKYVRTSFVFLGRIISSRVLCFKITLGVRVEYQFNKIGI